MQWGHCAEDKTYFDGQYVERILGSPYFDGISHIDPNIVCFRLVYTFVNVHRMMMDIAL